MQTFLGALNYYGRFIRTLVVYDAVLDQLKDDDFGPGGDPTSAKAPFPELKKRVTETPILRQFDSAKEENELDYHPAKKKADVLLQLLKVCNQLLAGKTLRVFTRFSTLEQVFMSKSLYCRTVGFAVMLSPFDLKVRRVRERNVEFTQLIQASISSFIGLDESL
ncbi:hypothetical protein PC110_g19878 [Phytophthora cactorum]|uniref:Reverse transcriptase RNase H-like domain-containing protein n=1 Tax=Phytophthora cactorum TaxID=29920 RepID=A0A329RG20_9STRA|nr:hypothetical protein PC111_g20723 [Phytophthora cactorum]KAG2798760.1 hypothetical protein PC112_g21212 [Phytophthora cactorum]KAG2885700.1 hypothetical protein PC115_g20919 [Phytophthora cactorum]KAG3131342.1 hypothetical protein C6341_g23372 [Phytophthora cactorum]KAG3149034.1 hypothetical protein PC128_g23477 [Phytophthora cactorum]